MSDQILSQEEIDALLQAVDSGEVSLSEEKKEGGGVVAYDLTSQNIMLREQFELLEEVYDRFTSSLRNVLYASLRRTIEVDFVSTEMLKFSEFLKAFSAPTSFHVFGMEPLFGSALLATDPGLAFSLIDCVFGGKGKTLKQVRDFTAIEQRVLRRIVTDVLRTLERAWEIIIAVKTEFKKYESKPQFVHLVAPNDLVINTIFSLNGPEFSGNIYLCIPYLMLEPIKDKLCSSSLTKVELNNTWNAQLRTEVRRVETSVIAQLGRTTHTIRDLLGLQVGDVIKLSNGPQDAITLMVEGVPKYQGYPGVVKGNRAVQISRILRPEGYPAEREASR